MLNAPGPSLNYLAPEFPCRNRSPGYKTTWQGFEGRKSNYRAYALVRASKEVLKPEARQECVIRANNISAKATPLDDLVHKTKPTPFNVRPSSEFESRIRDPLSAPGARSCRDSPGARAFLHHKGASWERRFLGSILSRGLSCCCALPVSPHPPQLILTAPTPHR